MMCSGNTDNNAVGDRIIINPKTINYPLPVTESDAIKANFTKGSCFYR